MADGQKRVEGQKKEKLKTTSEEAKKKTYKAWHRNKWWEIKTANNEEDEEHGVDYQEYQDQNNQDHQDQDQDYQDDDNTEPVCSSDKHGNVGLAIDTTS